MASYTTIADWQDVEAGYVVHVTIRKTQMNNIRVGGPTAYISGRSVGPPSSDDNAHEPTKGHERHTGDDVETINFPGMLTLYDRFKRETDELSPVSWDWPE